VKPGTRLSIAGDMTILSATFDPLVEGFRILLDAPTRTVFDVTVPPGAYSSLVGVGWTVRTGSARTKWSWKDKTTTGAAGALNRITITQRSSGLIQCRVKGKIVDQPFFYAGGLQYFLPGGVPLTATFVLNPPTAGPLGCGIGTALPLP